MEYKLYFLDRKGHIEQRVELDCDDDQQAIQMSVEQADGRAMDLWQDARRVKKFESSPRPKA